MGPMCFDYGFGPFRWVCASGDGADLDKTDAIAQEILEGLMAKAPEEIRQQMDDNIRWIKGAKENKLVVGSQARILYADSEGRIEIARAFNKAIAAGEIGPVVLAVTTTMSVVQTVRTARPRTSTTVLASQQIWPSRTSLEIVSAALPG